MILCIEFRNNNPDKGTETQLYSGVLTKYVEASFRNNNPDKGTETKNLQCTFFLRKFRNNNPDKGTETNPQVRL